MHETRVTWDMIFQIDIDHLFITIFNFFLIGIMQLCTLFNSPLESYLGEVVEVAMKLEAALPAGLHHTKFPRSPYHAPLARVLNQNPRIAVQYFLPRLNQRAVYHL